MKTMANQYYNIAINALKIWSYSVHSRAKQVRFNSGQAVPFSGYTDDKTNRTRQKLQQ